MYAIIRPEHYMLPVKHPANCQCSEHGSKTGYRTSSIAGQVGVRGSIQVSALKPSFQSL